MFCEFRGNKFVVINPANSPSQMTSAFGKLSAGRSRPPDYGLKLARVSR